MAKTTIKKGDKFWVMMPRFARADLPPQKGTIVAITDRPAKQIGIEFENEGIGSHRCDGRAKSANCLWVRASHLMTKAQVKAYEEERKTVAALQEKIAAKEINELEIDL
jgi:hypothetical protein